MTTTFYLIRHAAHGLLGHKMAGCMSGVCLSDIGQAQAAQLAERLSQIPLSAIYSSPLERAQETAAPIAARMNLPIQTCPAILEINYGDWTGLTFEELQARPEWKAYNQFRSGTRIPGGEMMLEAQTRTVTQMQALCLQHPNESIALVSHADIIKGALTYYLGMPLDVFLRLEISPASVSIVALNEFGPRVLRVNDTGSLLME